GGVSLHDRRGGVLFSGDTLFRGGPGATGRSFSSFATIIDSIRDRLLPLPDETVVHTGHGDDTTIGEEAPHLDEWIARGRGRRPADAPAGTGRRAATAGRLSPRGRAPPWWWSSSSTSWSSAASSSWSWWSSSAASWWSSTRSWS